MWMARVDPKRRRHAVSTNTHVLNRGDDNPLLLSTRQAGAAIEGPCANARYINMLDALITGHDLTASVEAASCHIFLT
jgi:hypothetical protein